MRMLLVSTYELGHQPLHVASPAGLLRRAGNEVRCVDLSVEKLDLREVEWAHAVAISVPMHTAMRIALEACSEVRSVRPQMPVCLYGLYAHLANYNANHTIHHGDDDDTKGPDNAAVDLAISGEYEGPLLEWADGLEQRASKSPPSSPLVVHLGRSRFALPARELLPPLDRYARLSAFGREELAGYVEASHGCAHRCRHCPVPVVYDGRTRLVGIDAVVQDVSQLVRLGARHISFGDPDFLNGPHHAMRVISAVHEAFGDLTFDVTAKVEHVLAHSSTWPTLARSGCLFVVSAFESTSPEVLTHLAKGHTLDDEVEAVRVLRCAGIEPRPSFLPFTPWTSASDVLDLLDLVLRCDLVGNVDPVQYAIRLLVPPGSLLLSSKGFESLLGPYDRERLSWTWHAEDARLDELASNLAQIAVRAGEEAWPAELTYQAVRRESLRSLVPGTSRPEPEVDPKLKSPLRTDERPHLTEPWFCCAEPTASQLRGALIETAGATAGANAP